MIRSLLSADYPRSRAVAAILLAILAVLALAPFVFPSVRLLAVAAKVLVFILLVASYDLLLGYTGIVSFAHTMFFGIGAYGVAIASTRLDASWGALAVGILCALALSAVLALVIGLFSLRVKAIFFAMITLAVASAFQTLASQLSEATGGEDGLSFKVPRLLRPSFEPFENPILGLDVDGRVITYYLLFFAVLVLFLMLIYFGFRVAIECEDRFGSLLAAGIVSMIGVQTVMNVAVVIGLMPTTGLPLPFFSAGGTSISILMAAVGVVLNIAHAPIFRTDIV